MAIYRYEFCDGTVNEVEVSDEWYALLIKMDKQEKNNDRRQTRRHVSLDYLNTFDLDIEAPGSDPITGLIKSEDKEELHKAINFLSPKQRKLITQFVFEEMTTRQIAETEGVDRTAISHRLGTIYKKLRKLL